MTKNTVPHDKYNRREVRFHFWPNASEADRATCLTLDAMPQGERGAWLRMMVNAGVALQRIDSRLPLLLSAVLKTDTTVDELVTTLSVLIPALKEPGTIEELAASTVQPEVPVQAEGEHKNNLNKLLGRG